MRRQLSTQALNDSAAQCSQGSSSVSAGVRSGVFEYRCCGCV